MGEEIDMQEQERKKKKKKKKKRADRPRQDEYGDD